MSKGKIFTAVIFLTAVFIVINYFKVPMISDVKLKEAVVVKPSITVVKNIHSGALKEQVEKVLLGITGSYGIAIKNLKTGESFYLNEHQVFQSASLYKNWIMAVTYNQISKGLFTEEDLLSQAVLVLNDKFNIQDEDAERTEGVITMKVKDALEQMITVSHNYAALLLSEKVRLSSVEFYLQVHGLKESSLGVPPKTTAYDTALFYEKLYKGKLADQVYTKKMLDLLKGQKRSSGLPKYLPANTEIAHKTGELGPAKHDGGILFSNRGDYIIVVMSETASQSVAEERIANISKAVYEYFQDVKI